MVMAVDVGSVLHVRVESPGVNVVHQTICHGTGLKGSF